MDRIFCDDCGHESTAHMDGCTVRSCMCRALVKRSQVPTPRRDIGTCKECRFLGQANYKVALHSNRGELGACQRRAPAQHEYGPWPIVRNDWWCGEFERRELK